MAWILLAVLLTLLMAGFPLFVPLLTGAFVILLASFSFLNPETFIQQMIGGIQPAVLIAVPMFILAADIMTKGHTADRLLDLVLSFVGHVRGGLPISTAVSCTLFGAVSGSTQATVVAMGTTLRPKLLQAGYSDRFSMALIINSSDIALLIPPSIGMIIYGVVSGTSVGELFVAGIGPGLLVLLMFTIYCYVRARISKVPVERKATWRERWQMTRKAVLALGFPVIVVGGIYTGFFSPTEAAAVSVLYACILEILIYRAVKLRDLPALALSTGTITAVVFLLVAAGAAFSWMISFAQLPQELLSGLIEQVSDNRFLALGLISIAYFIGCMFVDPIVVILILTPVFGPLISAADLDPVLVGTVVTLQAAIGSATPPFGCDIFTAMAVFRRPYIEVIRGTPPFIVMLLIASVLLIAVPEIALLLRDLAFDK